MAEQADTRATGRVAGLAYLVIIVFSSAGYLTATRLLDGDAHAVIGRLAASPAQLTLALVASVIGLSAWIVVGILIQRLTSAAGRLAGLLMLVFVLAGVATNLAALAQLLPVGAASGPAIDAATLTTILQRYNRILLFAQVFSGLWLLPFGWLVFRSRIAPRFLGLCLMLGSFGYLSIFANAMAPGIDQIAAYKIVGGVFGVAVLIGEAGICLWLLLMGASEPGAIASSKPVMPARVLSA